MIDHSPILWNVITTTYANANARYSYNKSEFNLFHFNFFNILLWVCNCFLNQCNCMWISYIFFIMYNNFNRKYYIMVMFGNIKMLLWKRVFFNGKRVFGENITVKNE